MSFVGMPRVSEGNCVAEPGTLWDRQHRRTDSVHPFGSSMAVWQRPEAMLKLKDCWQKALGRPSHMAWPGDPHMTKAGWVVNRP